MRVTRKRHVQWTLGFGCAHVLLYLAGSLLPAALVGAIRAGSWLPWLALVRAAVVPEWFAESTKLGLLWCAMVWLAAYWFVTGLLLSTHGYWRQREHRQRHPAWAPGLRRHLLHFMWEAEQLAPAVFLVAVVAVVGALSLVPTFSRHPDLNGVVVFVNSSAGSGGCAGGFSGTAMVKLSTGGIIYASMDLAPALHPGQSVTLNWQVVSCGRLGYEAIVRKTASGLSHAYNAGH
jgi:hypothetical protein